MALNALRRHVRSTLSITVVEGLDGPLDNALLSGELDFVIGAVGRPASPADIVEDFLLADPYVLAVGHGNPIARRQEVSLAQLREQRWLRPRPGGSAYAHVHAMFLNAGVAWPDDCINTNSVTLAKRLISQSEVVALVSSLTLAGWEAPISAVRVPEAGVGKLGVRRRKMGTLTPLAERFLDILRDLTARPGPAPVGRSSRSPKRPRRSAHGR